MQKPSILPRYLGMMHGVHETRPGEVRSGCFISQSRDKLLLYFVASSLFLQLQYGLSSKPFLLGNSSRYRRVLYSATVVSCYYQHERRVSRQAKRRLFGQSAARQKIPMIWNSASEVRGPVRNKENDVEALAAGGRSPRVVGLGNRRELLFKTKEPEPR